MPHGSKKKFSHANLDQSNMQASQYVTMYGMHECRNAVNSCLGVAS